MDNYSSVVSNLHLGFLPPFALLRLLWEVLVQKSQVVLFNAEANHGIQTIYSGMIATLAFYCNTCLFKSKPYQEDRTLLTKWTPLAEKYSSEWVGPGSPHVRSSPSPFALGRIPETDENGGNRIKYDSEEKREHEHVAIDEEGSSLTSGSENDIDSQQDGASVGALASGLAKRDEKKGSVVYNRYYHVFKEGELERLACGIKNAVIRDRF
ncbi:hypothetical protein MKW98_026112 [Papaver atlanticum]|uniref:Uncharacterized protein n=1 Tax=Papaver atlanticum TaxID=357466 RepID=A0AAD4RYM8_9MAGN|nr:hypothetical protein MKW98_026112 [Papaver atlanticum]